MINKPQYIHERLEDTLGTRPRAASDETRASEYALRGMDAFEDGNSTEAKRALENALESDPQMGHAHAISALILHRVGQYEDVETHFSTSLVV